MKHFEFIEEQGERRTLLRKQPHRIGVGALGRVVVNLQTSDGFGQATQEPRHIVVGGVEREPRGGDPFGFDVAVDLVQRRRLAEAGGCANQEQFGRCRAFQPLVDRASLQ